MTCVWRKPCATGRDYSPRHVTRLFDHSLRPSHFPKPWREAKFTTLPKPSKDPKSHQNLRPVSILSTTGKLFSKVILERVQTHTEGWGVLNSNQFCFRSVTARHFNATSRMSPVNPVTNPDPIYSHSVTWQYVSFHLVLFIFKFTALPTIFLSSILKL